MSSVKIILKKGKVLKNGEHPIMLRIISNRKASYNTIGASCSAKHWDDKNNLPKKSHPDYSDLLVLIDKKRSEANKLLLKLETDDQHLSATEIRDKIKKKTASTNLSVLKYFEQFIERLENANRIGYADAFRYTRNSLRNFKKEKDFYFSEVDGSFIMRFEAYLDGRDLAPNSIFLYLRTFKTLINYAKKDEIVNADYNPFADIDFTKYRNIKTRKRAISKDEMGKILDLDIQPDDQNFHYWNYFRFSYVCWGINFIDMAYLKWDNFLGNTLHYVRRKTGDTFSIQPHPIALEILSYYKAARLNPKSGFIFPIFNESHSTAKGKDYRYKKIRKEYNKALKEIGKKAGLTEKLTTYVARHTFAHSLKTNGTPMTVIKETLGHESEKMTEIYTSQLDTSILSDAVNKSI